jgi:hypothetical protein
LFDESVEIVCNGFIGLNRSVCFSHAGRVKGAPQVTANSNRIGFQCEKAMKTISLEHTHDEIEASLHFD